MTPRDQALRPSCSRGGGVPVADAEEREPVRESLVSIGFCNSALTTN